MAKMAYLVKEDGYYKMVYGKQKDQVICKSKVRSTTIHNFHHKSKKAKKLGYKKFEDHTGERIGQDIDAELEQITQPQINMAGFEISSNSEEKKKGKKNESEKVARLVKTPDHYMMEYKGQCVCKNVNKNFLIQYFKTKSSRAKKLGLTDFKDYTGEEEVKHEFTYEISLEEKLSKEFTVQDRFLFLEQSTNMILNRVRPSLFITGTSGIGKTHNVLTAIKEFYDKQFVSYKYKIVYMKGVCTPKALYEILYDNHDKNIVFDDCDKVFDDDKAVKILMASTDSYAVRTVHYASTHLGEDEFGEKRDPSFDFTGNIIFITNKKMKDVDSALLSRALTIDITLNNKQILELMGDVLYKIGGEENFSTTERQESFKFIKDNLDIIRTLSLRSLIDVMSIRQHVADWKKLAKYTLMTSS